MLSVSSPLGTFFQQAFHPSAADQNARSQPLQPAGWQTSAPADTVSISGYVSHASSRSTAASLPAQPTPTSQPIANQLIAAPANTATTAASIPAAPTSTADSVAITGGAASTAPAAIQGLVLAGSSQASQQQELAQLDQLLQQLGVDPNSIPLSDQLNMVLYLNDPSALAQLVQSLGQVVQIPPQENVANSGAIQAEVQAPPAGNSATSANASNSSTTAAGGFTAQFQEFQLSLQAIGANPIGSAITQPQARAAAASSGAGTSGKTLNVVV